MNGRAAKRIRLAAERVSEQFETACKTELKKLKCEYLVLPYHKRKISGVRVASHTEALRRRFYLQRWQQ